MKNVEFGNVLKLFRFNLFIHRKTIIGWSVALFSVMFLYMILFSSVQDIATAKVEMLPQEMLQLFGMENLSDMANYTTYYGSIYTLILVAVSFFSATFSTGLILKEEKTKSIEFLNGLCVSRTEIFIAKYLTTTISTLIICSLAIISAIICGVINGGETFVINDLLKFSLISSFSPLLFSSVGFKIAGISADYGTGAVASGVVILSYLLGYLGQLLGDKAEFLTYLSPFIALNAPNTLDNFDTTVIVLVVYIALYIASLIAGCIGYNKRDLKI